MKNFSQFIKEEITIKGNDATDPSYLRDVEKRGREEISDVRDPGVIIKELMTLAKRSQLISRGKEKEIEELAEKMIRDIYSGVLENVKLDLKLVKSGSDVKKFMDEEDEEEETPDVYQKSDDEDLKSEVDKRKMANVIMQGEAKNTKMIMEMPECKEALVKIFGEDKGKELHETLLKVSKLAHKIDLIIPVEVKADMMERAPEGMAGAVSVDYEKKKKEKEEKEEDEEIQIDSETQEEEEYSETPVIKVRAIDFAMLLHEAVKGIYELIARVGIPKDEELARNVFANTSSFEDEAEDFKYGPYIAADLRDFVNKNVNIDKYPNIREFVFGKLMEMPAKKFLFSMKNILMETPEGRKIVDDLITNIISELVKYDEDMADYEYKLKMSEIENYEVDNTESDIDPELDNLIKSIEEKDPSKLSQSELQELVDSALDRKDYKEVERLHKYLKEGREIYSKELIRINESKIK